MVSFYNRESRYRECVKKMLVFISFVDRENLKMKVKEMEDASNDLKRDYEEQVNKLRKTDVSRTFFKENLTTRG